MTQHSRALSLNQQGDYVAAAFDTGAAVGGALIAAAAVVAAPALAVGLAIAGIGLVLAAAVFHLGR